MIRVMCRRLEGDVVKTEISVVVTLDSEGRQDLLIVANNQPLMCLTREAGRALASMLTAQADGIDRRIKEMR